MSRTPVSFRLARAVFAVAALATAGLLAPALYAQAPAVASADDGAPLASDGLADVVTGGGRDGEAAEGADARSGQDAPPAEKGGTPPAPDALLDPEMSPSGSSGIADMLGPFIKSMLMLGVVVGVAYLTLHKGLGKLMTRTQMGKRMKVVERVSLDQRRSLYLVEIDGHEMVVGGGESGVVHLKDIVSDDERASPRAAFRDVLSDASEQPRTAARADLTDGKTDKA